MIQREMNCCNSISYTSLVNLELTGKVTSLHEACGGLLSVMSESETSGYR